MRKYYLTLFVSLISLSLRAQVNDYCDSLRPPISAVQSAACFEAMVIQSSGFSKTYNLMKVMDPSMTDIVVSGESGKSYSMVDMAYHATDINGPYKGITRVALQMEKNVVTIIATLPYDSEKDDSNYAEVAVLLLHNGETQLCTYGKFLKQKLYNDDNKFLHIVTPDTKVIEINGNRVTPNISLIYSSNYILSEITIGSTNFKIQ